jgi:hypothetical protein
VPLCFIMFVNELARIFKFEHVFPDMQDQMDLERVSSTKDLRLTIYQRMCFTK